MAEPLADVAALEARLGYSIEEADLPQATAALADASTRVRFYGLPWPDPATAPDIAVSVTLAAAERRVRNPENYRQELEGSYQYALPASLPVVTELTAEEIAMLRAVSGTGGAYSVQIESLGGVL